MLLKFSIYLSLLLIVFNSNAQSTDYSPVEYIKPLFDFEITRPVFKLNENQAENKTRFLRYIVFTGYREGIEPIKRAYGFNIYTHFNNENGTANQRAMNLSIEEMLTHGMPERWQVILDVKDPSRYRYHPSYGSKLEWLRKNAYCMEFTLPQSVFKDLKILKATIADYFKVSFTTEKRTVETLALSFLKDFKPTSYEGLLSSDPGVMDISQLKDLLYEAGLPVLENKTGQGNLLFKLDTRIKIKSSEDLPALKKAFLEQGFILEESKRELSFYIIKELKS